MPVNLHCCGGGQVLRCHRAALAAMLMTALSGDIAVAMTPTVDLLGNLSYQGIYDQPVTLVDGAYEGEPFVAGGASRPRVVLIPDLYVVADLDGNDSQDAAVLLKATSSGSGEFIYLAVVAERDGALRNVATRRIGDRVKIRSFTASDRVLILDLVVAGPQEAACCPTLKVSKRFRFEDEELVEAVSLEQGPLLAGDLEGVTWKLIRYDWNEPVPEGIEITAVFRDEHIAGKSACNRYTGGITDPSSQGFALGPVAGTRMACAEPLMSAEDRYYAALGQVSKFTFHLGRLAMIYRDGDTPRTLLFEASE